MSAPRLAFAAILAWSLLACTAGGGLPSDEDVGGSPETTPAAATADPGRSPFGATADPSPVPARTEAAPAGCRSSESPDLGDDGFTPFSHQLSAPDPEEYPFIFGSGIPVADPAEAAGRFPSFLAPSARMGRSTIQLILVEDVARGVDPGVRVFYGPSPVEPSESLPYFVRRGGSVVRQELTEGQSAQVVKETLGDRAVIVPVGRFEAALIHADPSEPSDFRPYHLYWSDGARDWTIISGVADPRIPIDFAREMYCET